MTIQELEEIIDLYGNDIYAFCLQLTGSKIEADELYQDTFLKTTEKIDKLNINNNVKSFIISVAVRIWKNKKRKYAWRNRIAPCAELCEENIHSINNQVQDLLNDYLNEELNSRVRNAVFILKDNFRIPVLMYYMQEMSVAEIANALNISQGTVKSRLYHARKLIERELEEYLNE